MCAGDEGVRHRDHRCRARRRHQAALNGGAEQTAAQRLGGVELGEVRGAVSVLVAEKPDRDLSVVRRHRRPFLVALPIRRANAPAREISAQHGFLLPLISCPYARCEATRVLREVVARGSFSAAAESLHLSQSAVSQQVAALEREVGMQLLERTSDGPKLTPAGETLVGHGDAVIARLDEAERELAEIAGLEGGRLRLVSFPTRQRHAGDPGDVRVPPRASRASSCSSPRAEPEDSLPALRRGDSTSPSSSTIRHFPRDFGRDTEAELILRGADAGRTSARATPARRPRR